MANTECYEEQGNRAMSRTERGDSQWIGRIAGWPYFDIPVSCYSPPLDVLETEAGFKVLVELPGVEPSEVSLTVEDGNLIIKGEKKIEQEGNGEMCACSERCAGAFKRVLKLPSAVSPDGIEAHLSKGVLEVTLPKREEAKPHSIDIKTE